MDILEICREALEAMMYRPGAASKEKAIEALVSIRAVRAQLPAERKGAQSWKSQQLA